MIMRFVLIALLAVHGLIHVLGFARNRGALGGAWLVAASLLVVAAVLATLRVPWWWVAAAGVVLSQVLVVRAWPEARVGTIANVVLAIAIAVAIAQARFDRVSHDQIAALLARVPPTAGAVVERRELATLPPPVARWLDAAGVVGRPRPRMVRLRQRGAMRTAIDQPWMAATAEQYFSIDQPGFVWTTSMRLKRVLPIAGRDHYADGRGRMLITTAGVPVVDASGPKLDEGALQRFLGELVWFPAAALAPYVAWSPIDAHTARATMTYRGVSASVELTFDDADRVVRLEADRYLGGDADARRERWRIPITAWGRFDGITVPTAGEVTWQLATGEFSYYRWQITALEYDRRERWTEEAPAAIRLGQ